MKKISFLMAALLVAMVGCQKEPQATLENPTGVAGYVSLKISLPSVEGTKADTQFNDGEAYEYKVNDVTVVFYNDAEEYVYHTGVSPEPWDKNGTTTDNITVSGKTEAIAIKNPAAAKALVLVNVDGLITDFNKTYDELNAEIAGNAATVTGTSKNDFFMSNAPYYKDEKFTTLVPVTLKSTESEALESAANVKVERAAAKVQVVYNNADPDFTTSRGTAQITGWNLDITNKSFYPVRKGLDKVANGWFKNDLSAVNGGLLGDLRIYMAVDPNYNEDVAAGAYTAEFDKADDLALESEEVAYCLENTFAINAQNETQTTRALLAATYTPTGLDKGKTWFQVGSGKSIKSLDEFAAYVVTKADEAKVSVTADAVKALAFVAGNCNALTIGGKTLEELVGDVTCYLNGVCYYPVKVRHFTTAELGYADETAFKTSFEAGGYKANDLGRYGV